VQGEEGWALDFLGGWYRVLFMDTPKMTPEEERLRMLWQEMFDSMCLEDLLRQEDAPVPSLRYATPLRYIPRLSFGPAPTKEDL
jgi:hypothetical protein